MADTITVNILGLKELAEAFKQMPERIAGKALGASVASGAAIIREAARANARANFKAPTGATEKSVVVYRKRGSTPGNIGYHVAVTMKKVWPRVNNKAKNFRSRYSKKVGSFVQVQPAYWWFFNEFGTSKQAAKPLMRPAFDGHGGQALAMIKLMLEKAVVIAAAAVPKYLGR